MRVFAGAVILAAAFLVGCGKDEGGGGSGGGSGGGGGSSSSTSTPEDAFKAMKAAGEAGDAKALWKLMSRKTQDMMKERMQRTIEEINKRGDEEWEEAAKDLGKPAADLKKMSAEELMIAQMEKEFADPKEKEKAKAVKMDKTEMRGEVAVVFTTKHDGKKDLIGMVKEDGNWKLDMVESQKLEEEADKLNK